MPKRRPMLARRHYVMHPTKERCRHNGGVDAEISRKSFRGSFLVRRYRAAWECPLDMYRKLNVITLTEHRAGLRFRRAYFRAVSSRSAAYERLNCYPIGVSLSYSERLLKNAHRLLPLNNLRAIINICGHDRQIQSQSEVRALRDGLGQLARHWGSMAMEVTKPVYRKYGA